MRLSQTEKMEIIRIVEQSEVGVVRTLKELSIPTSTFYKWYAKYCNQGYDGLAPAKRQQRRFWNQVPPWEVEKVVQVALDRAELSPRELAYYIIEKHRYFISESTVYRMLNAFEEPFRSDTGITFGGITNDLFIKSDPPLQTIRPNIPE